MTVADGADTRMGSLSGESSRRKARFSLATQEAIWFYIFVGPWLVAFLVFTFGPMVASLILSFTQYNAIQPPIWIGLKNFVTLSGDPVFWKSIRVTFTYALVFVPLNLVISLFLAAMLNLSVPAMRLIRTIYYLPAVLPEVVTGLVWIWIFNPDFGLLNYVLYLATGIKGPNWLGSETWVMPAVIISALWGMGSGVIIFLASLQSVPPELYEAAEIDGATALRRYFTITLPMISPVILFNLLVGTIGALQVFARIYVMTQGGPNYASYFYNLYLYSNAFSYFRLGLASAQAWILFVVIMILTLIILRTSGRWVYYAGGR